MKIYDTLSKQLKELPPPEEQKKLNMFVCGPTVYDYIHIGNARTFVIFDVVAKYLKHKGYDVTYIQNITDIDNKIIERALEKGEDPLKYAKKFSKIFKDDMAALGVTAPEYKNATDHIPEVIKQVEVLLKKGNAYPIEDDGIYFDLSTFPDYGKLSGRTASMANDAVSRIDDSDKKRNKGDFAIWKFTQEGDPSWPAPFGDGRPGWHIEDTAITEKYFGPQYDIHGGGQDLIFPHHEAEIALEESASGKKPFVKYWMHSGFLVNKDEKMSKSAGNFETLHDLLKKYSPETLRYYLLGGADYHSPLGFSIDILNSFEFSQRNILKFLRRIELYKDHDAFKNEDQNPHMDKYKQLIEDAFADDMNIPKAIGAFNGLISLVNDVIEDNNAFSLKDYGELKKITNFFDTVLGTIPKAPKIPENISNLAHQRESFRLNKDWDRADELRIQIQGEGYEIDDTNYGPLLTKLPE